MSVQRRAKWERRQRRRRGDVRGTSTAHRCGRMGDLELELEPDHPLAVWMRSECPICSEGLDHGETGQQAP